MRPSTPVACYPEGLAGPCPYCQVYFAPQPIRRGKPQVYCSPSCGEMDRRPARGEAKAETPAD